MIGKIQRVDIREVWKHEAHDFTCWLEENIDVISDQIGVALSNVEREKGAGDFSVDLVAVDATGATVIIENQLAKSDHDHLGKVITYLVAMEAKTAIWITPDPRPEHIAAVSWLNESTPASFYLFKLEAVRINESIPAPLLTRIVGPTVEGRAIGAQKLEMAGRDARLYEFWTRFLDFAGPKLKLFADASPTTSNTIYTNAGAKGGIYAITSSKNGVNVDLHIDGGNEDRNRAIFQQLLARKDEIDQAYGDPHYWDEMENRRASRIRSTITSGGYAIDEAEWPALFAEMVDRMNRMEKALDPFVRSLKV